MWSLRGHTLIQILLYQEIKSLFFSSTRIFNPFSVSDNLRLLY
nr:MAG TPA: hypothetical protein [Caudoviricetes sp.]